MFTSSLAALCLVLFQTAVHAEAAREVYSGNGSISSEIKDVLRDKKFEEDDKITDLETRAQAGSQSRYSFKVDMGYAGPPVDDLNNSYRPNPDNRPGDYRTNLSGTMGLRYRLSTATALNFGTGLRWFAPYQAVSGQNSQRPPNGKNYDVNDPQIAFDDIYASGPFQMRSGIRAQAITADYFVHAGQWGALQISQSVKFVPVSSRFVLGLHALAHYFAYDRDYRPGRRGRGGVDGGDGRVSKYTVMLVPSVEYRLSRNLNLDTSLGYGYQNLRSDGSWWRWNHDLTAWRVGLGWAVKKDIYFNPFISFFAEAPAFTTASLGFNTIFSIF